MNAPDPMRHALAWYEVLIVLAVIAITAAIALPGLVVSKTRSNEAAAAAWLRSSVLPAQVQFQAGGQSDIDHDGRGEYAMDHRYLAGAVDSPSRAGVAIKAQSLLPRAFDQPEGAVMANRYRYQVDTDVGPAAASIDHAEDYFAVYAVPATADDGRRAFAIGVDGILYASVPAYGAKALDLPTVTGGVLGDNTGTFSSGSALLLSDPRSSIASGSTNAERYQR